MPRTFFTNAETFWSRVKRAAPDECWPWLGARTVHGYGKVHHPGKRWTVGAHRVALSHAGVEVPDNLCVLHSCDNPICCNPAHLRVGTNEENVRDRRNRRRCGSRNGPYYKRPQLSPEKVWHIRELLAAGLRHKAIAAHIGTSQQTVSAIKNGITWADV
jgi:hypothetical protein